MKTALRESTTIEQVACREPSCFGRYRVLRSLGRGGFGEVFLSRDEELERLVAVKVQHREPAPTGFDADGFVREARLVARLDHPGIVPVYDVGRAEDGRCYIVSKYIEGMTLLEVLRRCRPPFREAARIIISVSEALQHAHDARVVHRDLKPSNILISTDGEVFLTDFGIALTDSDFESSAALIGTPSYMSPEQAGGQPHRVDGRSDTFALGTIFYEMLTGQHPFSREGRRDEILARIRTVDPRPPREVDERIPADYERICRKALAKSPEARYSARELADDLRRAADFRGPHWPWIRACLLVMTITMIIVLAFLVLHDRRAEGPDDGVARWIIESGGSLKVVADPEKVILGMDQLPPSFRIGYVDLGRNRALRDEDLRRLEGVRQLGSLDLNLTSITDEGLKTVGRLSGLAELWLNQTRVTGDGLKHLGGLQSLVHLDLYGTNVDDDGIEVVGKLTRLRFLDLSGTRVTDDGLAHLKGLTSLEVLRLEDTSITDAGIVHLKALKTVKKLILDGTRVTEEGRASLRGVDPR